MSIVAIGLNLLLAALLAAALWMGARLNGRLKLLRESHEGFARAVGELNAAAARAERGLAELRAASDEASELLGARIETARNLTARLDRLVQSVPAAPAQASEETDGRSAAERRFGALLAAVQQPRARGEVERADRSERAERLQRLDRFARREPARPAPALDDDLFDEPAPGPSLARFGGRR